jgi:hypothetical protein
LATFTVLKSRVSKTLGLDETASGQDDTVLGYELNDGVRDFLLRTHVNVNRSETVLDEDTDDSEIPDSVLAIQDLQVVNADAEVWLPQRTTPAEIMQMRRSSWGADTGTGRYYALNGSNLLMFHPALVEGDTILMYYVPKPTEMSSGTNDPSSDTWGGIPVEYHPALVMYACWKMADYDDDSSSNMGLSYQQQYEKLVRDCRRFMRNRGGRSLGRAVVGRRRAVPSQPSQDVW